MNENQKEPVSVSKITLGHLSFEVDGCERRLCNHELIDLLKYAIEVGLLYDCGYDTGYRFAQFKTEDQKMKTLRDLDEAIATKRDELVKLRKSE